MLRYFRLARASGSYASSTLTSLWARRSLRSRLAAEQAAAAAAGTAPPVVYNVKVNNQRHRIRNAVIALGALYLTHTITFSILRTIPRVEAEGEGDSVYEEYYDEDDEDYVDPDEKSLPLPWTFEVVQAPLFRVTDPEWQAYKEIARDRELVQRMFEEILDIAVKVVQKSPGFAARYGGDIEVLKHWLELDFPIRPAPIVLRKKLMLLPHIGIVTSKIDAETSMQIERALVPEAFLLSAYAFLETLFREQYTGVARYFGWRVDEPVGYPTLPSMIMRLPNFGGNPATQSRIIKDLEDVDDDDDDSQFEKSKKYVPYELLLPSVKAAMKSFMKTWKHLNQEVRPPAPRGSVVVSGLVDMRSSNAQMVVNVLAFWDPKKKAYDAPSMIVKLHRVRTLTPL